MNKRNLILLLIIFCLSIALPPAAAQTTTGCEPGFWLLEAETLATDPLCVPENPQRIAAVDTFTLETLLALGIKPVSGPFLETFLRDHPQFTQQLEGVTETGWPVNPEALLVAHPDLIISIQPWVAELYEDIAEIAPTVSITYGSDGDWEDIVRTVGAAVNQSDALDTLFADYDARLQIFKDGIAAAPVGDVSVIFLVPDTLLPFFGDTFSGSIVLDSGLVFPEALTTAAADGTLTEISLERLDLLSSSHHIFVVTSGFSEEDLATYETLIAELEADPLWQSLPAVQAGNVHVVGRDWLGSSLIAANTVIDDLLVNVEKVDPRDVSPNPFLGAAAEATETASGG
jgi:iron complex transport system substrate-binding protein